MPVRMSQDQSPDVCPSQHTHLGNKSNPEMMTPGKPRSFWHPEEDKQQPSSYSGPGASTALALRMYTSEVTETPSFFQP